MNKLSRQTTLMNNTDGQMTLQYELTFRTGPGELRNLLRMASEFADIAGIFPEFIRLDTKDQQGESIKYRIGYDPSDVKRLLAGRMTEQQYFEEHHLII